MSKQRARGRAKLPTVVVETRGRGWLKFGCVVGRFVPLRWRVRFVNPFLARVQFRTRIGGRVTPWRSLGLELRDEERAAA